jgi:SAM-dependent methyltransferase
MATAASMPPQKNNASEVVMHDSSMLRMKWFKENFCSNDNKTKVVLDVGSYCVEGHQSYRDFFNGDLFKYIGLDMAEGPNVTIRVKTPYQWNEVSDNFCDILISGQAFEHIEFPWITIREIARVVKPNGLICIIAPNGLGLHRYPVDCWRYYSDGMIALAKWAGLEILHVSTNLAPQGSSVEWYGHWQDCMLIARKPETGVKEIEVNKYTCKPQELEKICTGFIPIKRQPYYRRIKEITIRKIIKAIMPYGIIKLWRKI